MDSLLITGYIREIQQKKRYKRIIPTVLLSIVEEYQKRTDKWCFTAASDFNAIIEKRTPSHFRCYDWKPVTVYGQHVMKADQIKTWVIKIGARFNDFTSKFVASIVDDKSKEILFEYHGLYGSCVNNALPVQNETMFNTVPKWYRPGESLYMIVNLKENCISAGTCLDFLYHFPIRRNITNCRFCLKVWGVSVGIFKGNVCFM